MMRQKYSPSRRGLILGTAAMAAAPLVAKAVEVPNGAGHSISQTDRVFLPPDPRLKYFATARHRTAYLEIGPKGGPLMIFVHGVPELSLVWRRQLEHFAGLGWRCVAPDMRGFGRSSAPDYTAAYAVREAVTDMLELHDALGGGAAVWVGHDWGSEVVWAIAAHHPHRCRRVVNLCVPYQARGPALVNLLPLVDRKLYPADVFPAGQWDYWLFYREHFSQAAKDFDIDVEATVSTFYRRAPPPTAGKPSPTASVRANGGWFGPSHRAPAIPRDETMLGQADFDAVVAAFRLTGFSGANAWYMNDEANLAYAAEAPKFGRLTLPVLFIHAARDVVCDTLHSQLAGPMREDCSLLKEATIDGGHLLMLEQPGEVNRIIAEWL